LYRNNLCPTDNTIIYYLHTIWHIGSALGHVFYVKYLYELDH
jgi:hypothetical protein